MRRRWATLVLLAGLGATTALGGCAAVQPWERGSLGLGPMRLDDGRTHRFERSVEVYREGAVGGNGGTSGGGCGCS